MLIKLHVVRYCDAHEDIDEEIINSVMSNGDIIDFEGNRTYKLRKL